MRPPINRNLTQRIRQALYQLKKDYGAPIDIYKLVASETNVRTGEKVITKTVTHVRRAVVVPARIDRVAQQTISLISANKQFVSGGTYDSSQRDFIIDRRDVPALPELTADDWIIYNRRKYQVKTVEAFEVDAGWVVTARELVGEVPELILEERVKSTLALQPAGVPVGDLSERVFYVESDETLDLQDSAAGETA
jgi:hypothetical protein